MTTLEERIEKIEEWIDRFEEHEKHTEVMMGLLADIQSRHAETMMKACKNYQKRKSYS
jgi:hypothetical protein